MTVYAILLCMGLWVNRKDPAMLALTLVVAAGIFFPVPRLGPTAHRDFYLFCLTVDSGIILAAMILEEAHARLAVIKIGVVLCIMHIIGLEWGPQSGISPYRQAIPVLEYAQQIACIFRLTIVHREKP